MEAWRKSTHNVDELIAARTGNPFESATTKICYHCHEKIINPAVTAAAATAPAAQPTTIDLLDSDDDDVATAPVNTITANAHPDPSPLTANTSASFRTSITPATLNLHQAIRDICHCVDLLSKDAAKTGEEHSHQFL